MKYENEAQRYAHLMVERELTRWGDQLNAQTRCADRCGLTIHQFKHVYDGRTKNPGERQYSAIRAGYLSQLDDLIASLTAEQAEESRKTEDLNIGFVDEEIADLQRRLDEIRARRRAERSDD